MSGKADHLTEHILQVVLTDDGEAKVLDKSGNLQSKATSVTETMDLQTFTVIESIEDANSGDCLSTIDYDPSEDNNEQEIEHELCELILNDGKPKSKRRKTTPNSENELSILNKRRATVGPTRKKFTRKWLSDPLFSDWLEESTIDGHAYCIVCSKILQPGKSELIKHTNTAKHKKNILNGGDVLHPVTNNAFCSPTIKKTIIKEENASEHILDFRSECFSKQTFNRENLDPWTIGNDIFREDPSVRALEKYVSDLLDKECCLLTLNGTSANNISILTHCLSRFSLVVAGSKSFIYKNCQGTLCELGKLSMRPVTNLANGTFDIFELKAILKEHTHSWPTATVVCVENTHTLLGGQPIPVGWLDELGQLCSEYGIPIHMDAVRLGNASVATGETMANLVRHCSSVSFHLDKSFNAIGGCVIAGKKDFINRALRVRNMMGGTFPQLGVIARSALSSLQHFTSKISRNHANALSLAEVVSSLNSDVVSVNLDEVRTNIVMLKCDNITTTPQKLCERLQNITDEEADQLGERIILKALPFEPNLVRLLMHSSINTDYLRYAMKKLHYVISETGSSCYSMQFL